MRLLAGLLLAALAGGAQGATLSGPPKVVDQCRATLGGHGFSNTTNLFGTGYKHVTHNDGCSWPTIGVGGGALVNLDAGLDDWDDATNLCLTSHPQCLSHPRIFHNRLGFTAYAEPQVLLLQVVWTNGQRPVSATHDATDESRLARWVDFMLDEVDEHYPGNVPEVWCMTPVPYCGTNDCNGSQTPGEFEVYDRAVSLCEWCRDTDGRCSEVVDMGGVCLDEEDHWYEDLCHQDFAQRLEEGAEVRDRIRATGKVYGPP